MSQSNGSDVKTFLTNRGFTVYICECNARCITELDSVRLMVPLDLDRLLRSLLSCCV